jgi:hypothetical protein
LVVDRGNASIGAHVSAQLPTHAWVTPYLCLGERVRIGPWEVIPADSLSLDHCRSQDALAEARGLIELYRRPPGVHEGFGCFLRRGAARIGERYRVHT